MDTKDFLEHIGVLGMKWGRRKNKIKNRIISIKNKSPVKKDTENESDDSKKKDILKKKPLKEMSNAELKEFTTRLQLEKQYKDLNKTEVSAGRKFVNEILGQAVKQTAATYATKYMTKGVEKLLSKAVK